MILLLFGMILTAAIIIYFKVFYEDISVASGKIAEKSIKAAEDFDEYEFTKYEDEEITGSQVVNYIKEQLGDYTAVETAPIYVRVISMVSGIRYSNDYWNKSRIKDIRNVSVVENFIKPTAHFTCEVLRSENKVILGICFTQK
jgi:membrane-associated HD superfamily phosphohydrolase